MSEPKERTRKINPMFGFLALIVAFGALVLVANQPAAADTFTSINTLVGAVTLAHFTSLNLTTSGNTLTLGINLGHANTWTADQTFKSIFFSADNTYNVGSSTNRGANSISNLFSVYHASGDANPTTQVGDGFVKFGAGGGSTLDESLSRIASGYFQLIGLNSQDSILSIADAGVSAGTQASSIQMFGLGTATGSNIEFLRITAFKQTDYEFASLAGGTGSIRPIYFYMNNVNTFLLSTTGLGNSEGFQSLVATTLSAGTSTTVSLPVAEPDTTYGVVCTLNNANPIALSISGQTTTQFVINYPAIVGSEKAHCIIWHQ